MARATFRSHVAIMRFAFRDDLRRGVDCGCAKTAATCRELLAGETHLWTLVRVADVEPTNNDAERALRHGVIDRKLRVCPIRGHQAATGLGYRNSGSISE